MFSVHLLDESAATNNEERAGASADPNSGNESSKRRDSDGQKDSTTMTEAQRRYLFRILADRGVEGDAAHEQFKQLFGVDSLASVGKDEASSMIKRLLKEVDEIKS